MIESSRTKKMSAYRNALSSSRRKHLERGQPEYRAKKFPILEKKKDYLARAADFQSKQKQLVELRELARNRNPDEFYFGMIREKTEKGIVVGTRANGDEELTEDMMKVLNAQDEGYLRTIARTEKKRIEQLKKALLYHDEDAAGDPVLMTKRKRKRKATHVVFEDKDEEASLTSAAKTTPSAPTPQPQPVEPSKERRLLAARLSRQKKVKLLQMETQYQRVIQTRGKPDQSIEKGDTIIHKWDQVRRK